jgi:hypothetical protein
MYQERLIGYDHGTYHTGTFVGASCEQLQVILYDSLRFAADVAADLSEE